MRRVSARTCRLRAISWAALLLAMPAVLPAQSAAPAVRAGGAKTQPGDSGITLRANSSLVIVDVVVSDEKHNPVHNLKASQFTLLEDKAPQQIKSFEEQAASAASAATHPAAMPKLPPGIFTNYSPAPASGTVNVLLLDALNTPMNAQDFVKQQLLAYLKDPPPAASIAIFGLSSRLTLLQGFTSDPSILKAAVAKAEAQASTLLNDPLTGNPAESITDLMTAPAGASDVVSGQIAANVQQFEAARASYQLQQRARYTLTAMDQLARYLVSIPGRKNLIWFSGSFPFSVLPNGDLADPFSVVATQEQQYRETTNALARSQVAVYPIDARGIVNSPIHASSSPAKRYAGNPHAFAKDQADFYEELFAEHDTMQQMAQDTGGQAFVETDGLTQAVAQAIQTGSNYYTIAYAPANTHWNGKYRKIEVRLSQPGVKLSYRRGYFADDPNAPPKPGIETAATAPVPESPMNLALMRGAPGPSELIFKVRILPAAGVSEESIAKGNQINPDPKAAVKGPFRRYLLDFLADPGSVTFTRAANGNYQCAVEFVTFVYDRNNALINTAGRTARADLTAAEYVATIRAGIPFHQEISVPAKGEFYLRSAVHDLGSDRVGAVEVPVASVASLPPAGARTSGHSGRPDP